MHPNFTHFSPSKTDEKKQKTNIPNTKNEQIQ